MNLEDRSSHIKKIKKDISNLKSIGVDGVFLNKKNKNTLSDLISNKDKKSHFQTLEEIKKAVEECELCTLHKERTKTVFSRGNNKAKLMFIGEGPGKDEDATGLPFVGRAGKLLDKIIEAMNLSSEEVYICNIVKCRPPSNRKPELEEMECCSRYLLGQISLVKPKIIVCLGATAAEGILGTKERIMDLRSKFFDKYNAKILVTYHPAALLRDGSRKKLVWEDMQLAMKELLE
jgi:DNA polymerase